MDKFKTKKTMQKINIIIKLSKLHFLIKITKKYNQRNRFKGRKFNI